MVDWNDLSDFSNVAGFIQRRDQLAAQQETNKLLQAQQAERNRKKRLPKCPCCQGPLERHSSRCPSCHSGILMIELQESHFVTETPADKNVRQLSALCEETLRSARGNWMAQVKKAVGNIGEHFPQLQRASSKEGFKLPVSGSSMAAMASEQQNWRELESDVAPKILAGLFLGALAAFISPFVAAGMGMWNHQGDLNSSNFEPDFISGAYFGGGICLFYVGCYLCFRLLRFGRCLRLPGGTRWLKKTREALSATGAAIDTVKEQTRRVEFAVSNLSTVRTVATKHRISLPSESKVYCHLSKVAWRESIERLPGWEDYQQWANHIRDVVKRLYRIDSSSLPLDKLIECGLLRKQQTKREAPARSRTTGTLIHIRRGKQAIGPFPPKRVRELIDEGKVKPSDLLRLEGDANWRLASEIPSLTSAFVNRSE